MTSRFLGAARQRWAAEESDQTTTIAAYLCTRTVALVANPLVTPLCCIYQTDAGCRSCETSWLTRASFRSVRTVRTYAPRESRALERLNTQLVAHSPRGAQPRRRSAPGCRMTDATTTLTLTVERSRNINVTQF